MAADLGFVVRQRYKVQAIRTIGVVLHRPCQHAICCDSSCRSNYAVLTYPKRMPAI